MTREEPRSPDTEPDAEVEAASDVTPCRVCVTITLSAPVACPGHSLQITAEGTPLGGDYEWSVSGAGAGLSSPGALPGTATGPVVFLKSFNPDHEAGNIPAQSATVTVTYTHPDGTATDTEDVPIHGIEFAVTNLTIAPGVTQANEEAHRVTLGGNGVVPTILTEPVVEIQLDPSCPRKRDCASTYRTGWLQTVREQDHRMRYTHSMIEIDYDPFPIRDQVPTIPYPGPMPFYWRGSTFTGDGSQVTARHEDTPQLIVSWIDPRPGSPAPPPPINRQLREVHYSIEFTAWLVARNEEWWWEDQGNCYVFLRHFDWSMALNVNVDTTLPVGNRCAPRSSNPTIGSVGTGRGPRAPVLTAPHPTDGTSRRLTRNPAPAMPP